MTKKQKLVWAGVSFFLAGLCPTIATLGGDGIAWFFQPMLGTFIDNFPHDGLLGFVVVNPGSQVFLKFPEQQ